MHFGSGLRRLYSNAEQLFKIALHNLLCGLLGWLTQAGLRLSPRRYHVSTIAGHDIDKQQA
jgi:hypothetical protein